MIFTETKVRGAYAIDIERRADERGYFARTWCQREAAARGLATQLVQINISSNVCRGTLRGMHFQRAPRAEVKIVSCTRGAIYDVVLDLREDSPTYLRWDACELTAENRRLLYVPAGCAHGFQSLVEDTELLYLMSEFHSPEHAGGVRCDDPAFAIEWPLPVSKMSPADREWPDYRPGVTRLTGMMPIQDSP